MAGDGQGSGRRRQQVPVPGGRQEWLVLGPDPGAETPLLSVGVGSARWETTVGIRSSFSRHHESGEAGKECAGVGTQASR